MLVFIIYPYFLFYIINSLTKQIQTTSPKFLNFYKFESFTLTSPFISLYFSALNPT